MTRHRRTGDRLAVVPALDAGDVDFLAGFSRRVGHVARIWPGQPAVPCPWIPCDEGCCLVLSPARGSTESPGQWLRFLITEFLAGRHRVDGWVSVPGPAFCAATLLIVEAGDVFEGVAS